MTYVSYPSHSLIRKQSGNRYVFSNWQDAHIVRNEKETIICTKLASGGAWKTSTFNRTSDPNQLVGTPCKYIN
eukprot:Pgem_evm1s16212